MYNPDKVVWVRELRGPLWTSISWPLEYDVLTSRVWLKLSAWAVLPLLSLGSDDMPF